MTDAYEMRTMTRNELDGVIEWAAAEGWNPGRNDAPVFYSADPGGFFTGLLNGEPIASISAVQYGSGYAFVGFYIVKPEHRGKGYGLRLWQQAMASIGDGIAGLDGVLAQTGNYERSGFVTAYHNMRYQGIAGGLSEPDPNVAPFAPADLDVLSHYDRACFPAPRSAFLEGWLKQPDAHALVYKSGDALQGYGIIRPARSGYRIGPLFADDRQTSEALFEALVSRVPPGSEVYIDIPQPNAGARELVSTRKMSPMFETARMYRGGTPEVALDKVFGVTSLELG